MRSIVVLYFFLIIFFNFSNASDIIEIVPITSKILTIHFDDGYAVYHKNGQQRSNERIVFELLNITEAEKLKNYTIPSQTNAACNQKKQPVDIGRKTKGSEFTWMCQNWNHACALVWDAQNESVTDLTGEALEMVRHLNRSNRPWDSGYSPSMRASDPIETHPYRLQNYLGKKPGVQGLLYDYFTEKLIPDNGPSEFYPPTDGGLYPNPIIINEFPFYWINRDGLPTGLTKMIYDNIFDKALTPEAYRLSHAQFVAKVKQYWRVYRTSAVVQHFVMLDYSRGQKPRDATSDNFIDIPNLILEPNFERYMKSAMYPVCIHIDRWEEWFYKEEQIELPIMMINDNPKTWKNKVTFQMKKGDEILSDVNKNVEILGYGETLFTETIDRPKELGNYTILVFFTENGENVFSEYNFEVREKEVLEYKSPSKWVDKQYIHATDIKLN